MPGFQLNPRPQAYNPLSVKEGIPAPEERAGDRISPTDVYFTCAPSSADVKIAACAQRINAYVVSEVKITP